MNGIDFEFSGMIAHLQITNKEKMLNQTSACSIQTKIQKRASSHQMIK